MSIGQWVDRAVQETAVYDLHTHLYPPSFGPFMLWGIDETLNYHYLIAEALRAEPAMSYERFWGLSPQQQADFIWKALFVDRPPLSEACRGVITVLQKLGLDVKSKDLAAYRRFFSQQTPEQYVDRVFKLANVHTVVMTNDALDPAERDIWLKGGPHDPRFKAVLRIDPVLLDWPAVGEKLSSFGYQAGADLGAASMKEVRRFFSQWIDRMQALYVACSLTPDWRYPDDSPTTKVINEAVLPICRERNLPFAMMIGVRRRVNPLLRSAGDSVGKADITSVDRICSSNPHNKFMLTMLARENQHELTITARKHRNLFLFGCWWFLNNPSLIEEMTRMRMEMLGPSFTPQHSDARILDQIIYKWSHSRQVIAKVLTDKFTDLSQSGWPVSEAEIRQAAGAYFSGNFEDFLKRPSA